MPRTFRHQRSAGRARMVGTVVALGGSLLTVADAGGRTWHGPASCWRGAEPRAGDRVEFAVDFAARRPRIVWIERMWRWPSLETK